MYYADPFAYNFYRQISKKRKSKTLGGAPMKRCANCKHCHFVCDKGTQKIYSCYQFGKIKHINPMSSQPNCQYYTDKNSESNTK